MNVYVSTGMNGKVLSLGMTLRMGESVTNWARTKVKMHLKMGILKKFAQFFRPIFHGMPL